MFNELFDRRACAVSLSMNLHRPDFAAVFANTFFFTAFGL